MAKDRDEDEDRVQNRKRLGEFPSNNVQAIRDFVREIMAGLEKMGLKAPEDYDKGGHRIEQDTRSKRGRTIINLVLMRDKDKNKGDD